MKGKQSRKILTLIISISLILLIALTAFMAACAEPAPAPAPAPSAPTPPPAEPVTIVFAHQDPPGGIWETKVYSPWFADLEERSGGRLKIEAHWAGELVDPMDAYDATIRGAVDMAHFMPAWMGKFPMDDIQAFTSYDVLCYRQSRLYWELHNTFPEVREPYSDTKLLFKLASFPAYLLTTERKPIRKLEDNQGAKMIHSGKWGGLRGEALGWTPTQVMPGELFAAFDKGVLDGIPAPFYALWELGGLPLHYVTFINLFPGLFGCTMNLDTWSSLPADIQKLVEDTGEEQVDVCDEVMLRADRDLKAKALQELGMEFIELSPEEKAGWVEADKPVREAFIAELEDMGLPGSELMEEFLRLEKKYAADEYALK